MLALEEGAMYPSLVEFGIWVLAIFSRWTTPSGALVFEFRDHSWQDLEDPMGYRGSNIGQLCVQMASALPSVLFLWPLDSWSITEQLE